MYNNICLLLLSICTVLIYFQFSEEWPDRNIWDNLQGILNVHFEEFALVDDSVETSQLVGDIDIVANVLCKIEPDVEQVDSDDNETTEADDADYISSNSQFLHIVTHQKAFVQ